MTDIAVTCMYAATFWTPEKLHIICKTSKKACCQTVAEGGCIGKHKDDYTGDSNEGNNNA